jgi:hypothetical protein
MGENAVTHYVIHEVPEETKSISLCVAGLWPKIRKFEDLNLYYTLLIGGQVIRTVKYADDLVLLAR